MVVTFFMVVVAPLSLGIARYHRISLPSGSSMSNQLITLGLVSISGPTTLGAPYPLALDGFVHAWRVDGIDAANVGGLAVA